jgi:predicted phage gp36 major capsid-like protein
MERNGAKDPEGPPESVGDLPGAIAARVEDIVRAAENEAAAVQRDLAARREAAEAEAQRYLAEARRRADMLSSDRMQELREATGELVERAEATTRQLEALLDALTRTVAALQTDTDGKPAPAAAPATAPPGSLRSRWPWRGAAATRSTSTCATPSTWTTPARCSTTCSARSAPAFEPARRPLSAR